MSDVDGSRWAPVFSRTPGTVTLTGLWQVKEGTQRDNNNGR